MYKYNYSVTSSKPHHDRTTSRDMEQSLKDELPAGCILCKDESGEPRSIAEGSFATVYCGEFHSPKFGILPAAVKAGKIPIDEIQTLLECSGHPGIVQIYAWALRPDDIYGVLVMQRMSTDLLECLLQDKKGDSIISTSNGKSERVMRQMLDAITFLHSKQIAHCDVKPENVLVDLFAEGGPDAKLADFGLARNFTEAEQHICCGTEKYRAPEIPSVCHLDIADVWPLGILLYVLVYGDWPPDEGQMDESYPPMPTPSHPDVTKWLNAIRDMLTGDRENRPSIAIIQARYPALGVTDVLRSRTNTCPATPPPTKKRRIMDGVENPH